MSLGLLISTSDQISTGGQPDRHLDHLSSFPAPFRFRLSHRQHAPGAAEIDPHCAGKIFHQHPERSVPEKFGLKMLWPELPGSGSHVRSAVSAESVFSESVRGFDMKWLRIRELVRKEFIQLFRDRKKRPLLIVAPLDPTAFCSDMWSPPMSGLSALGFSIRARPGKAGRLIDAFEAIAPFESRHDREPSGGCWNDFCLHEESIWPSEFPRISAAASGRGDTAVVQILADGSMSNMTAVRISYTRSTCWRFQPAAGP